MCITVIIKILEATTQPVLDHDELLNRPHSRMLEIATNNQANNYYTVGTPQPGPISYDHLVCIWPWDGHYKSILLPADEEIMGSL
jgi:hypothetical protein